MSSGDEDDKDDDYWKVRQNVIEEAGNTLMGLWGPLKAFQDCDKHACATCTSQAQPSQEESH